MLKLLEQYGTIAKIPKDVLERESLEIRTLADGTRKISAKQVTPADRAAVAYSMEQSDDDRRVLALTRLENSYKLPDVPAYGKYLQDKRITPEMIDKADPSMFIHRWIIEENPNFWRGKRILDIGCWYDRWAKALTDIVANDFSYTGVEINEVAYETPEQTKGKPNIQFVENTAFPTRRDLYRGPYDIICSMGVDFRQNRQWMAALRELLEGQGHLITSAPLVQVGAVMPFAPSSADELNVKGFTLRQQIWRYQKKFYAERAEPLIDWDGYMIHTKD